MAPWPESWAGCDADMPFGQGLVAAFGPFIQKLCEAGLSKKTIRGHLNNLWVIGGEVVRQLDFDRKLRKQAPAMVLMGAIEHGEAPLAPNGLEHHQAALDATARKLARFLASRDPR